MVSNVVGPMSVSSGDCEIEQMIAMIYGGALETRRHYSWGCTTFIVVIDYDNSASDGSFQGKFRRLFLFRNYLRILKISKLREHSQNNLSFSITNAPVS